MTEVWECAVVGGGAAGLSAALVLGRARRRTIVVDANEQSNLAAPVVGGLLGYDQGAPSELYAFGRAELSAYPSVEYRRGQVDGGRRVEGGFELDLDDGSTVVTRRVLLATGMRYGQPEIPGAAELWGTSVFQCPFCHGWEMRGKRLAALAAGERAVHAAVMLRGWTDDVVLVTDGRPGLSEADERALGKADVTVEHRRIVELTSERGELTGIAFADGTRLARDGLLVEAPLKQRSSLAEQLETCCAPAEFEAQPVDVDAIFRTKVESVFAAGDACTREPHLSSAIDSGCRAAMTIVQSLLADEFGLPYPPT
ncbi:NAD(P)/FAD-dependent oxidoreductase [Mycobacterium yunnanensis]|uniref:NAD(P)/FAD-dependent oxidoreductase n=1 Tax=Mycobacterium yunnanensis TaxID=368477 RepID=A0A9X2YWJ8_9MYCO|nr:NAD(P)/FAD-dependent oxidoreductase [Mycobacterium yunnanensis]MCV7420025.1 NAD(P)/FAD-dependent oxidoreductase [Mycobacterium yunnanensis]